jgi:UDP-N-acetylglucosamine diphosphorylase/glucosamine-1-phosphate N-acetyltransferase
MRMTHSSRIIIFDDDYGRLGPMTDLRASFEVRTGMFTTAGRICAAHPKSLAGYWTPERLTAVVAARADAPVNDLPDEETLLCVNGRWGVPDDRLNLREGEALIEESSSHVIAAHMRRADAEYFLNTGELSERVKVRHTSDRLLYRYPWDVIALMKETIPHDVAAVRLTHAAPPGRVETIMGDGAVEIHDTAEIGPHVVFDVQQGPIVIHEHAVIRPHAVLCGPCSIGRGSTVLDHALIKAHTVIGPGCKIAGEVGATIFQGFANKAHDGHLGDSWVGKWVNLGAGTTNSNLLNTYGEVTMRIEPNGRRHRTGLTFLGSIIGDHVKTAIGTRLMTGTVLGTGAMIASTAAPPATVRRFAWITDDGERVFRYDKFLEVVQAVMARRDKTPDDAYLAAVRALYDLATADAS